MDYRKNIKKLLNKKVEIFIEEIEIPPDPKLGDYAVPCFRLAKKFKKSPVQIAADIVKDIKPEGIIQEIKNTGPYINFFLNKTALAKEFLKKIRSEKELYGNCTIGKGKTAIIEFSSPNIAKPFGIGHLRSTVIGNSLYRINTMLGYDCIRINHLGDWGTQFGKLIVAFKNWGSEKELEENPISHLLSIYVKFHEEAEIHPELSEEARHWFKKLEDGDEEATKLWQLFKELSLEEFKKYYKELSIDFDSWNGEGFYNTMLDQTIDFVKSKTKTQISEGALIVDLEDKGMPPLLLRKTDGASTYHTRDLAALKYRMENYTPEKLIYVVGSEQKLHFRQLFEVASRLGFDSSKFVHVDFGLFRFPEGKMSTRKGNLIFLEDVLDKAVQLASKIIEEKNPNLKEKEIVAKAVGIGAVIFGDLSNDRTKFIEFNWDRIISFEGETGPYAQYTHARICSIIRKYGKIIPEIADYSLLSSTQEQELIVKLASFDNTIIDSARNNKPHIVANYVIELCQLFNSFYNNCPILNQKESLKDARLVLSDCTRQVIKNGLWLLGIDAPEEM